MLFFNFAKKLKNIIHIESIDESKLKMFDNDIWTIKRENERDENAKKSKNSYQPIRTPFKKSKSRNSSNNSESGGNSPCGNTRVNYLEKDLSLGFTTI